jgi:3-keto-disaccharide hydrolase
MSTQFRLAAGAFLVALALAPLGAQGDGFKPMFDGKTLNGWRGYKKADAAETRWKVENGIVTIPEIDGKDTKGQRDIISDATYDQFDLRWEWKVAQGGNSGLKYFVLEDEASAIGHEYQMIDDERHPDAKIGPHRQTGAFYDVLAAADRPLKPAGEWNNSEVIVKGKHVEHYLNGKRILQYELDSPELRAAVAKSKFKDIARFGKPQKGHILIQDHGNAVWFRNVRIKPLT